MKNIDNQRAPGNVKPRVSTIDDMVFAVNIPPTENRQYSLTPQHLMKDLKEKIIYKTSETSIFTTSLQMKSI